MIIKSCIDTFAGHRYFSCQTKCSIARPDSNPSPTSARRTTKAILLREGWPKWGETNIENPCKKREVSKILRDDGCANLSCTSGNKDVVEEPTLSEARVRSSLRRGGADQLPK